MSLLKLKEFVPFAPSGRGEQVHIHHCKLGYHNDRLYIRRNEDDSIIAYCHHCGKRGYSFSSSTPIRKAEEIFSQRRIFNSTSASTVGRDRQENLRKTWDRKNRLYSRCRAVLKEHKFLVKSLLTQDILDRYQVKIIDNRICFPIFNSSGELQVVLGRGTNPKWLIEWVEPDRLYLPLGTGDTCVVVEDIVSAIRLAECGYSALPCLSSSLRDVLLPSLENYAKIIVWLDNDNHQVLSNRVKIMNKVKLVNDNVWVCIAKQPKDLSDKDINACTESLTWK
tara:strand:- start:6020 stop:6859 length:840 start_codon:yes stop_codon:yes gene_type:complete